MKKIFRYLILVKILVFINIITWAQTTATFTTNGTWTRPAGVTSIKVECWGSGGGGSSDNGGAGGGGGGAYARTDALSVSGATYNVSVGTGGVPGSTAARTKTIFGSDLVYADYGLGTSTGSGASGGQAGNSLGDFTSSGGTGGNFLGNNDTSGGGGGSAGKDGNGVNGTNAPATTGGAGGAGDNSLGGAGGAAGNGGNGGIGTANALGGGGGGGGDTGGNGGIGGAPGGGAGGGEGNGGTGADGSVVVTYTCPTYSLTSTSASTPVMTGNTSTVTLSGNAANLPTGTYTVTYNLSAPNAATGNTTTMTVSVAGTGIFTTTTLANAGATTVTITNLLSGVAPNACSSAISSNNTSVITVQTPQFDGTFETGATFAANLMTAANGATNYWVVGTTTDNGGIRSAYISNNGTANSYTITTSQTSHFYFDYTFPAGETIINFEFDWQGTGESGYDGLKVYLVPTSTTPVAGTLLGSGQIGDPWYNLQSSWQHVNLTLDAANAGTTQRIVFTWRNDASGGVQNPTAVDNIQITTSAPVAMSYVSSTVTQTNTTDVYKSSTNNEVIGIQIVTTGTTSPLNVSSFTLNTAGTTNVADITNAKLWTTGTSSTFATTTQLGATVAAPSGAFTINSGTGMPYTLSTGINYFWLTYDVPAGATTNNVIDATCTSLTVTSARTPSTTAPAGSRQIKAFTLDGTFETAGNTFTANGMYVVNNATNYWIVGTATDNGGTRSAYITNDGSANSYTLTTAQASHFYFDYTFPAGQTLINLEFDWKGTGESTYDGLKVFLVPTSTTPVAGSVLSSGQIGTTWYNLQSTWQHVNLTLDAANAGTTQRIVFTWKNDGSGGVQNPAAVDNIQITTSVPPVCVAPVCQPSALVLTSVNAQRINGAFTAGACSPSGYLVVYSTSSTLAPADLPINGQTYVAADPIGDGVVLQVGTGITFFINTLTQNTRYYFFIFAYNNTSCTGGPAYNTTSPLTNNAYTRPRNPNPFTAAPISTSQIDVTYTPLDVQNVVIVWNLTGTFTAPADGSAPPAVGNAFCGGTVLSYGMVSPQNHTGLTLSTTYYYKAYSYNTTTTLYSNTGVTANATTLCSVLSVPYNESFESITIANTLPTCMAATNLGTQTFTYTAPTGSYNQAARTGNDFASFYYPADDWIFTQGLSLTAGTTYDFSFWYVTDGLSGWTTLNAFFGNNQNSGAMTTAIVGATVSGPTNTTYVQMTGTFTPSTTGVFYCGIHCFSNSTPYFLSIDDINVSVSPAMTYVSCTTTQTNTTDVGRGNSNQQIIGIQVVTSGSSSPLSATSFTVNANGTTNINDINVGTAKIYYTGTSSTFATTTLFGSGVTPTIANYNITGTQTLSNGTNYFWLVYDISATATLNNFVDAQCTSLTVGSARTPSVTTPAGNRKIVMMYCTNTNTTNTSYYIDDFSTTGGTTNITNNNSGFSTNGYEYWPAEVVTQQQGISVNFSIAETGGSMHFGIWVDWNQDGDFADTDENVYINNSTYQTTAAGSFSVPGGATLGNTRMRVVGNEFGNVTACTGTSQTECEDYTFTVTAGVPMSYTSCTTTQTNTTDVGRGTTTQHIIGIQIVTTGGASPLSVTSFTVNANGTTAIADINAANSAKIYYTGTNSNFGTTTLFGQNTPTIANYNITGSQSLLPGTNYFWLVYDISATATVNNFVDAECTSLTVGSARTPSVTAPAGNRKIVLVYCTSTALWTSYMDITRVEFGGMNNTGSTVSLVGAIGTATGTAGMYSDWTSLAGNPTAQQGSTSNLIVRIGGSEYSHRVDVYFDFNQNGDLTDAGESFSVFAYANPTLAHLTTVSITIPLSASLGNTLMRVVCVGASNSSPCGTYSYGETEDYKINITAAPACSGTPTAGTASSDISSFCGTATPTLSATGYTIASGLTFQWQSASAIGGPYTDIPGATTLPYTVSSAITATTYYKLKVTCTNGGGNATTSAITVTNNAATITGTNSPVSINCNNTASLTATASAGTINWYSASTGGSSLATGSPYVTPVITANTSYYCSTISGGSSANVGKVSSPLSDGYYGSANTGLVFNAISAFTLISVKVYVQTAGSNVIIQLQDNTGTPITSSTFNSCPAGLQTLTLNFNVPIGTGYQLVSNNTNNLARDYSGSFPYTLAGTCSITGGLLGGSTSTTYYFFYDWVVSTGCESARTPVNIVLSGGVSAPSCSTPIFPLDLSTTVYPGNPVLSWSSVTGACQSATGYKFYFGTDAGATNIVNGTNLGDVTSYVAGVLTSPTSYFWKIVPTNTAGDASGCPIWSFTTTPSIIIGTDVTTSNIPTPYKGVYDDSKEQYIILKEELLAQGLTANAELTSLAFNVSSKNSTQQFSGYNINIGHLGAADDSYASATWKAPTWTNVYSGNFTTATGWNTHVFTSNFTWNGIDNIVIQVCFNNINTTASDYVYYNDDAPNSVCYNQAIGNVGCNLSAATVSNKRPNMKFTYIPVPTGESDIISANNETSNINYLSYQAAAINTVADGVRVWSFTVRDGGSDLIDADALSTNISNLSITKGSGNGVTDWTNTIRNAALFDGSTKIGEVNVTGEVISFTGLTTLLCTDNSAKTFDLYLSFEASAADNQQFEFEIKHSTASLTGNSSPWKTFSAKSSIVGDDNRLEVIASKIMFMVQPSTTDVDMIMFAYPEVSGVDVNNNLDLDFTGNISITSSGTLAGTPITYTAVNGIAALNTIRHTATATGRKLTATYSTWTAVLSEVFDIVTNTCVITTTPASTYGELYICNGTTINFTGSLTSGTPSAYRWELGNGTLATGATVNNVSYPLNAGYLATVTITNTLGTQCKANVRVMVSGGPNIDYITPGLVTCQTAPYTLTVGATSGSGSDVDVSGYSGTGSVTLSLADPTYLPDITTSTTEYTTTLTYNQFDPAATLTNANYVTVFANFEHSYFGDLEVWLVCPNGQNAHLTNGHANGGSWEFFGEPIDYDSSPTVGDGYDYRWSNATPGFMSMEYYTTLTTFPFTQTFTDNDGNTYTNHDYFPSGTYTPYDNFSSLVGCPLNGDWTIHVKDYLHSDDGTIFEWGLELDNSLMPPAWEYTADIISYDWVGTGISVHPSGPSVVVNPVVTTDYTLTITDEFGCETQRIVNMIVNNCPGVWTGAISTDWNTGGNWNGGLVPAGNCGGIGTEINVVIPDVSASSNRFPVISTDSYCDDLTILPGANLQIAFNGQLTVCGSIDNQATATGLVIKSTSAGTGSLFQNFGAVPATVERYMAGNEWHLAFPTTDAVAVTDYTGGLSSFYSYNETSDDYWNTIYNYGTSGWVAQIAGTTSTDYGYFYKDASSNTLSLDGGNLTVSNKNFAVTYTPNGHLGTDLVNVPVIGNMQWNNFIGWNLVGNPYGCAIDWNYSTGADYTSIENGIYMWDGTADNYKYYMNGGTAYTSIAINQSDATARYIPSGQAFFVKAKNSGTITIPYAARTHTTHSYWKEEGKIIPELLRFQIVKNEFTDETVIWLAAGSTDGHDSDFDLYKRFSMNNQFPQIYTFNNIGNIFALNSFPLITDDKIVPVGIYIGDAGEHTIEFTENNFSNVNVYLEDLLTNQMLNVRTTNSYTFTSVSGLIKDRFVLHFNINTAPVIVNQPSDIEIYEDEYFISDLNNIFEEQDLEDEFSVSISMEDGSDLPQWILKNNLLIEGTPENENVGTHIICVKATDLSGGSTNAYFEITVLNINDEPLINITPENQIALEDESFEIVFPSNTFIDIDLGDFLSYECSLINGNLLPSWILFDQNSLTLTGMPTNDEVGLYNLLIKATDLSGLSTNANFDLEIQNVNDAPYQNFLIGDFEAIENEPFIIDFEDNIFTDVDKDDVLTYSSNFPSWLSFDVSNLIYSGTPEVTGTYKVELIAKDLSNTSASAFFNILVSPETYINFEDNFKIEIYPNPTSGLFTIYSNSNKNIDLVITDIAGKEIKRFDNIVITNLQIDLTNYSCGIYYIEISSDDQIFREKIVKD